MVTQGGSAHLVLDAGLIDRKQLKMKQMYNGGLGTMNAVERQRSWMRWMQVVD